MHTYYILLLTVYVLKGDRSKKEDKEEEHQIYSNKDQHRGIYRKTCTVAYTAIPESVGNFITRLFVSSSTLELLKEQNYMQSKKFLLLHFIRMKEWSIGNNILITDSSQFYFVTVWSIQGQNKPPTTIAEHVLYTVAKPFVWLNLAYKIIKDGKRM